jgi:sec-independent protein translocase protein TatA
MERNTTMGSFSVWHWLIALAILLLLFGRGKIPELMGDVAKGIKNFKTGMAEADRGAGSPPVDRHAEERP